MIIKKFLHSCILIENNGKKLLIDPGEYSFIEKQISPDDIGKVDVLIFTHRHPDHYYPDVISALTHKDTKIVASAEVAELLKKEGFDCEVINTNEEKNIAGFKVKALNAPHEKILSPAPHNFAYLINSKFLHTGDSIHVTGIENVEVLALPVSGPWNKLWEAVDFAYSIKPKIVIPVHDGFIKDFFIDIMYNLMCMPALTKAGIKFKPLALGEILEI